MVRIRLEFVLCPCRMHGTFRNGDGIEGPDVASKEAALHQLDRALARGMISTSEAMTQVCRIQSSDMAIEDHDVPQAIMEMVRDWECMRSATNAPLPFSRFHSILDATRPA